MEESEDDREEQGDEGQMDNDVANNNDGMVLEEVGGMTWCQNKDTFLG